MKGVREVQKNIVRYMGKENEAIKREYNFLRENIAYTLRCIDSLRQNPDDLENISKIEEVREKTRSFDIFEIKRLSILMREEKLLTGWRSLMNDGALQAKFRDG
jgi:phosphate:Na+ symporter